MQKRLRVFVSTSFEEGDKELTAIFLRLLRNPRLRFEVRTAVDPQSRPFSKKIFDCINWADITLGIYTRRFETKTGKSTKSWVPPPYVISECSYALALYRDRIRTVWGLVEDGIPYERIGLNVSEGQEYPRFNREDILKGNTLEVEKYFKDISTRHSNRADITKYPYLQQEVRKTVEIYKNGAGIFKNTVTIYVRDASKITHRKGISHEVWLPNNNGPIGHLKDMTHVPVNHQVDKPFFFAVLLERSTSKVEEPLQAVALKEDHNRIQFRLDFPFEIKDHDTIKYQFVWGMPNVFFALEEDLIKRKQDYQEIALKANYGEIGDAVLRIKFERGCCHKTIPQLFSKTPYVVFPPSNNDNTNLFEEAIQPRGAERDSIFQIYEHSTDHLAAAMVFRWRPVSKRYLNAQFKSAETQERGMTKLPTQRSRPSKKKKTPM